MPLKGEARKLYMREYMRRKRDAERTQTKPAAEPTASFAQPCTPRRQRVHESTAEEKAAFDATERAHLRRGLEGLEKELAQAKARIADTAAENAALKAELASKRSASVDDDAAAAAGPVGKKVFKLLLKLDSSNDHEVLSAARKLVGDLKTNGSDLRVLADAMGAAWEKEQKAKPAPPKPIDYPAVEAAVTRYAADRTTVKLHLMWKALVAEVPVLGDGAAVQAGDVVRYVFGCLRRLGFKGSSSGKSWERK